MHSWALTSLRVCSFLFLYNHGQTNESRGKATSFPSQMKSDGESREAAVNLGVSGCLLGILLPLTMAMNCSLLALP